MVSDSMNYPKTYPVHHRTEDIFAGTATADSRVNVSLRHGLAKSSKQHQCAC